MIQGCSNTPTREYIYVTPDCYQIPRKALPEIDSSALYDNLTLVHSLHPKDVSELLLELPVGYDGHETYYQLVEREKLIVDMLIENETIVNSICKPRN